ncbi:hydrolase [Theileria orientalis strain Shintoku]|uniref:Hydrolase n=1 Tax=Theileria orientalis strain Shintoku TaxID=869250 RepID=J4C3A1_THEOR|nr:hydrolase [Theileria orientalis strain Shintoku]BAM40081.1 hydrolase [Theileria orientalis strain Shintoku]|eukprot:XP_009690382.1 hydrolase [Theileria orientalis strain Shintoku]
MGNAKSIANSIIFPAPQASYDHNLPDLIWIPKRFAGKYSNGDKISSGSFPALYIRSPRPSSLFFIYLHANCCDVGLIKPELYDISEGVNASIIAVEYPGYGISPEINVATGPSIDLRVIATFYFLLSLGIQPSSIVFFGRSIGTGPAACIASHFSKKGIECGGVILQAPYVSIHKIVQATSISIYTDSNIDTSVSIDSDNVNSVDTIRADTAYLVPLYLHTHNSEYFPLGSWLVDNFWDTEKSLREINTNIPVLIIHGLLDEIVPVGHGKKLYESCTSEFKMADFQPKSKHNYYSIKEDLVEPIKKFVEQYSISTNNPVVEVSLPNWCYFNSKHMLKKKSITSNSSHNTLSSSRTLSLQPSRSLSIRTGSQVPTSRSNITSSPLNDAAASVTENEELNEADLGTSVNRNICYNNFSSSLEGHLGHSKRGNNSKQ